MNRRTLLSTPNPFCSSPLIHSYIILFSLQARITLCSVNPLFQACEPKTCGGINNQTISFPFYIIGKQEPSCGFPDFGLTCSHNGFPIVNTLGTLYTVQEIFYNSQSLRVSIPALSEPSSSGCIAPVRNFSSYRRKFSVAPNQKEVLLFYGCDLPWAPEEIQEHRVGCSEENKTRSVVAFYGDDDQNLKLASRNCMGEVVSTRVEDEKEGIEEALRRGFLLNWTAKNCSECASSGGRCGFDQDAYAFRCYCRDRADAKNCDPLPGEADHKSVVIAVPALAVVVLILIIYCFRRRLWSLRLHGLLKEKSKAHQAFEDFLRNHGPLAVRRYNYMEIKKMTNSFTEKLGEGGYGGVFKGKIQDERLVAVKVLNRSKGNGEEFINEVASISRTSHVNIVTLLGFCFEGSKRALVYEFMSNGSLEKFIYGNNPVTVDNQLDCETLYQIAIGVARGLEYLHKGCNTRIFHFDIKPHNILLDENFCPKISDFGLAKICPRNESIVSMLAARGTTGFIAPEVFSRNFGVVSHKSDVYSFGMMVLEMVGGRKNVNVEVDRTSEIYFPYWIYRRLELNEELALRNITNESERDKIRKMVIVSLWCIQTDPSDRPTMATVVDMLEGRVETLQIPPKPFISSPSRSTRHSSAN